MRIGIRPTDAVKALRAVEAVQPGGGAIRATINLATGVLHTTVTPIEARRVRDVVSRVREALGALDGTCVVEHAPPDALPGLDVWGDVGPALETMRRLKQELDPASVLNPGRYVGGI
jgi:glycolate oxidase FAD binding subunit